MWQCKKLTANRAGLGTCVGGKGGWVGGGGSEGRGSH